MVSRLFVPCEGLFCFFGAITALAFSSQPQGCVASSALFSRQKNQKLVIKRDNCVSFQLPTPRLCRFICLVLAPKKSKTGYKNAITALAFSSQPQGCVASSALFSRQKNQKLVIKRDNCVSFQLPTPRLCRFICLVLIPKKSKTGYKNAITALAFSSQPQGCVASSAVFSRQKLKTGYKL